MLPGSCNTICSTSRTGHYFWIYRSALRQWLSSSRAVEQDDPCDCSWSASTIRPNLLRAEFACRPSRQLLPDGDIVYGCSRPSRATRKDEYTRVTAAEPSDERSSMVWK